MSLPQGHRIDHAFVCMRCLRPDDHDRPGGIGAFSAVDRRMGSGNVCSRCGDKMPYLATLRICPDGVHSISAPQSWRDSEKVVRVEREQHVLADEYALVYVSIGGVEVGLKVDASGHVEVWVHDDPYGEAPEPSGRWEHPAPRPALDPYRISEDGGFD